MKKLENNLFVCKKLKEVCNLYLTKIINVCNKYAYHYENFIT